LSKRLGDFWVGVMGALLVVALILFSLPILFAIYGERL
jgi:hypothetical protein